MVRRRGLKANKKAGSSAMLTNQTRLWAVGAVAAALAIAAFTATQAPAAPPPGQNLWQLYEDVLVRAKYVDLTHTITPAIPVWRGFDRSHFAPAVNPQTGKPYTYKEDGFEATQYQLSTDQLG